MGCLLNIMDRKIIQQSATSLGISLPKKWTSRKNLKKGDIVSLLESADSLILSAQTKKTPLKDISLTIPNTVESVARVHIWNAYRAGYDKMYITFAGDEKILRKIAQEQLIGFELFKTASGYALESVSEPTYDQVKSFIERQFFILQEMINKCTTTDLETEAYQLQKYDNFIKRSITKNVFSTQGMTFLWQFLSHIIQISRQAYYMNKEVLQNGYSATPYYEKVKDAFSILRKAYFSNDISLIEKLHEQNQKIFYKDGFELLSKYKNKIVAHYLISLYREIYFSSSALMGYLYAQPNSLSKS
jgi:hypothetical protein